MNYFIGDLRPYILVCLFQQPTRHRLPVRPENQRSSYHTFFLQYSRSLFPPCGYQPIYLFISILRWVARDKLTSVQRKNRSRPICQHDGQIEPWTPETAKAWTRETIFTGSRMNLPVFFLHDQATYMLTACLGQGQDFGLLE